MKPLIYYGQNREDLVLSAFFQNNLKGFYVDVGACDPIKFSVTKFFYERGWRGINIEPQTAAYQKLVKDRKRDINLNIGVADKPGELKLRAYDNESLSTFSKAVQKKYDSAKNKPGLGYKDTVIQVKTLERVFSEQKVSSIQFLKVDVEGFEYEVLKGNDWRKYRPEVLCVESNNMVTAQPWQLLLEKAGYLKVFFDGLNEYYVAKEQAPKAEAFHQKYLQLIVGRPTLAYEWDKRITEIVDQLERVQTSLDGHIALNKKLEAELEAANKKLNSPRFLAKKLPASVMKKLKTKASQP